MLLNTGKIVLVAATVGLVTPMTRLTAQERAREVSLRETLHHQLVDLQRRSGAPGITAGIALGDGPTLALAAGLADTALGTRITPQDRLLQGSVGKTYVSAVALQLVHEGLLDLDAKISTYLGDERWFERLPNHEDVTVRHLMTHTSGIIRYEFDERFIRDLKAAPDRVWRPVEQLAYLFDTDAPFPAGDGWEYSDTNYIILGMIIERLTGGSYYGAMRRRLLEPLALRNTIPSDSRNIPGLVQGYAGVENPFGIPDAVLVDGEFVINPQFEWTGGGVASTSEDLARWAVELYEGRAFDESLLELLLDGVPARLGPGTEYGLGVIIRPTRLGVSWGHSGFFPGYLAEVAYFPEHRLAVAVQMNSSDMQSIKLRPLQILAQLAEAAVEYGGS
jgi:D-alanyl-D-alanine carboxypeptidase